MPAIGVARPPHHDRPSLPALKLVTRIIGDPVRQRRRQPPIRRPVQHVVAHQVALLRRQRPHRVHDPLIVPHQTRVTLRPVLGVLADLPRQHRPHAVLDLVGPFAIRLEAEVAAAVALKHPRMHRLGQDPRPLHRHQLTEDRDALDPPLQGRADRRGTMLDHQPHAVHVEPHACQQVRHHHPKLAFFQCALLSRLRVGIEGPRRIAHPEPARDVVPHEHQRPRHLTHAWHHDLAVHVHVVKLDHLSRLQPHPRPQHRQQVRLRRRPPAPAGHKLEGVVGIALGVALQRRVPRPRRHPPLRTQLRHRLGGPLPPPARLPVADAVGQRLARVQIRHHRPPRAHVGPVVVLAIAHVALGPVVGLGQALDLALIHQPRHALRLIGIVGVAQRPVRQLRRMRLDGLDHRLDLARRRVDVAAHRRQHRHPLTLLAAVDRRQRLIPLQCQ